jgi:hypothetical protein
VLARTGFPVRTAFLDNKPYFYFNVRGLILYTQIDPRIVVPGIIVGPNMSKAALKELAIKSAQRMALRGATTLTEALTGEVGLTAEAVGADVGTGFGAAALTAPSGVGE